MEQTGIFWTLSAVLAVVHSMQIDALGIGHGNRPENCPGFTPGGIIPARTDLTEFNAQGDDGGRVRSSEEERGEYPDRDPKFGYNPLYGCPEEHQQQSARAIV